MKKVVLVLAVLLLTVPAMATVTISVVDDGNLAGSIKYQCNDPNKIRAFALTIDVNNGALFQTITGFDPNYWVYPGSINIVGNDVTQQGTPIVAGGGVGSNSVTIEMGSLYASNDPCGHTTAPDVNGILLSFTVDKGCCVTLSEDSARAGVVMEDTDKTFGGGYVQLVDGCISGAQPTCWDITECAGQDYGDADCDGVVGIYDLQALKAAWGGIKGDATYQCCADFDRDEVIGIYDLQELKAGWGATGYANTGQQNCPP
jgi:hypothetical protein